MQKIDNGTVMLFVGWSIGVVSVVVGYVIAGVI